MLVSRFTVSLIYRYQDSYLFCRTGTGYTVFYALTVPVKKGRLWHPHLQNGIQYRYMLGKFLQSFAAKMATGISKLNEHKSGTYQSLSSPGLREQRFSHRGRGNMGITWIFYYTNMTKYFTNCLFSQVNISLTVFQPSEHFINYFLAERTLH